MDLNPILVEAYLREVCLPRQRSCEDELLEDSFDPRRDAGRPSRHEPAVRQAVGQVSEDDPRGLERCAVVDKQQPGRLPTRAQIDIRKEDQAAGLKVDPQVAVLSLIRAIGMQPAAHESIDGGLVQRQQIVADTGRSCFSG